MTARLTVPTRPCGSCPYRRDVPSGVWRADEYAKLPSYDDPSTEVATFHCHQENATGQPTVCRGWLTVHADSIAARLAVLRGAVTVDECYADSTVGLWDSGAAAAEHGLRDIAAPSPAALAMIATLASRGVAS